MTARGEGEGNCRQQRRPIHVREDGVEDRTRVLRQIAHQLGELAVEIAEEQQGLAAQHREARVVDAPDGVGRRERLGIKAGNCSFNAFASSGDFSGNLICAS